MPTEILHVYGQAFWHDRAILVGTRAALERLRDAITAALEGGYGSWTFDAADGEGYDLHVVREDDVDRLGQLELPYVDDVCRRCGRGEETPDALVAARSGRCRCCAGGTCASSV